MANYDELFTAKFGGGKRKYYLDVKKDQRGEKYIVISESSRKEGDQKMRNRVMIWKEDFLDFLDAIDDLHDFLEDENLLDPEDRREEFYEDEAAAPSPNAGNA
ncbi:MAG: DUF3276 family protein [Candidatus Sumerlaeia bacterium]|nr:DUF3276 family protein [Candidatus Sumerlaeia bacterium]